MTGQILKYGLFLFMIYKMLNIAEEVGFMRPTE